MDACCCLVSLIQIPVAKHANHIAHRLIKYTRCKLLLAGFEKVHVPANGAAQAAISIPYADLAYYYPRERQMVLQRANLTSSPAMTTGATVACSPARVTAAGVMNRK